MTLADAENNEDLVCPSRNEVAFSNLRQNVLRYLREQGLSRVEALEKMSQWLTGPRTLPGDKP